MSHSAQSWLVALAVVAAALVVGFVIDAIAVGLLGRDSGPAPRARGAIARALRGQPEIWAVLLAVALWRPFDFAYANPPIWIDRLTIVLAVLSVTLFAARLSGWLLRAYLSKESVDAPSGSIFVNLTRMLVWVVGLIIVLSALHVEIGPLVASLGVAGLALSLGLQDTLANFFSGLQITMSRQILPGQFIRLSTGEEGTVADVTWRNTTLHAPTHDLIIVPNSIIARSLITNFTAEDEAHTAVVPFTVAFGSDLKRVERIALEVATQVRDEIDGTVRDFEPRCRFRGFGAEGISAVVTLRVERYQERVRVVSELVERLHARLIAEGIEFATPDPAPSAPPAPRPVQ